MFNQNNQQSNKIVKNLRKLSDKHHKMSFLFYELSKSIEIENKKCNSEKERMTKIKELNLDIDKLLKVSETDIFKISEFKKDEGKDK